MMYYEKLWLEIDNRLGVIVIQPFDIFLFLLITFLDLSICKKTTILKKVLKYCLILFRIFHPV